MPTNLQESLGNKTFDTFNTLTVPVFTICNYIDGCDAEGYHKNKAKRVRTTFTEEQLQVLQANFQLDSNPDGQDLERIAQITGLSKRVTQVWFQNSRARQKKHMHTGKIKTQCKYVHSRPPNLRMYPSMNN